MDLPFDLRCDPPFLVASFPEVHHVLSWSLTRPGFQTTATVAWIELRNADLPLDADPIALISERLAAASLADAVAMATSRTIEAHHLAQVTVEDVTATCLATVGLSNGERVGQRLSEPIPFGTINILAHVDRPLSQAALIEGVSIVASARTTAVLDSGARRAGVAITGTGTDCIVIAAPIGEPCDAHAGMHTAAGEAIGAAVYRAIAEGTEQWRLDFAALLARANAKST
ncbi:hypothetical protein DLM45_04315 [Hyphomicrobium methylovorum]|uniref:adenosylcobinamide amidohydrolase n=1 Tax=Hyphomicrobium methylovorum TaxID=84 RepID=UPI0015E6C36F|nr:adenosylcobinamide amidohydrolase [Hyphomicrobium methylovorum]MBA2125448.1 hypothetical protein [Hyphomicrobium methylovorum]